MPAGPVRSARTPQAVRRNVEVAASGARLDELGERPSDQPYVLVLARALGGIQRSVVPAEAIEQHCPGVLGQRFAAASSRRADAAANCPAWTWKLAR